MRDIQEEGVIEVIRVKTSKTKRGIDKAIGSALAIPAEAVIISSSILMLIMIVMQNHFKDASEETKLEIALPSWAVFALIGALVQYYFVGSQGISGTGNEGNGEENVQVKDKTSYLRFLNIFLWFIPYSLDGFFTGY